MKRLRKIVCLLCLLMLAFVWTAPASAGSLKLRTGAFGWPRDSKGNIDSYARWTKTSNNTMNFKFQVCNECTQAVVAVEYYYYTTDVWGENRRPADETKIYTVTLTDKIGANKTTYTSNISISNRDQVGRVYVRINRVKYEDGTICEMPASTKDDYVCWEISW